MGKKSRDKGSGFERLIASRLGDELGITLRRTPLSGGWALGNTEVSGDIVCTKPGPAAFPYCVECKNQEGWRLEALFTPQHKWFDAWWAQLLKACQSGRTPLLIFSRSYTPIFVSFPLEHMIKTPGSDYAEVASLDVGEWNVPYFLVGLDPLDPPYVVVMELEDFIVHLL